MEPENKVAETSSTGLDANIAGLLCYALGFVTGIAFLVLENKSSFVRFHAWQSTFTFLGLLAVSIVGGIIPLINIAIALALPFVSLILWIILMVKAFQGERYKLPLVGDAAEQRAQITSG